MKKSIKKSSINYSLILRILSFVLIGLSLVILFSSSITYQDTAAHMGDKVDAGVGVLWAVSYLITATVALGSSWLAQKKNWQKLVIIFNSVPIITFICPYFLAPAAMVVFWFWPEGLNNLRIGF